MKNNGPTTVPERVPARAAGVRAKRPGRAAVPCVVAARVMDAAAAVGRVAVVKAKGVEPRAVAAKVSSRGVPAEHVAVVRGVVKVAALRWDEVRVKAVGRRWVVAPGGAKVAGEVPAEVKVKAAGRHSAGAPVRDAGGPLGVAQVKVAAAVKGRGRRPATRTSVRTRPNRMTNDLCNDMAERTTDANLAD